MRAMVLEEVGRPLVLRERPTPAPGAGQLRLKVSACGVCRTDLHLIDGELPQVRPPIIPGHEIVGRVDALGDGVSNFTLGDRVGAPWLGRTCGACPYCAAGAENLCDRPTFTGYSQDGGYATHVVLDAAYCFPLGEDGDDTALAPLLCAGMIGWRSLVKAGPAARLGLYGFGAAAHIVIQVARWQGREVYAFTRPRELDGQSFARALGAKWAGGADEAPPEPLDAAIIYAPVGALIPTALRAVRKGGRVVCAGIHMSDIPSFPYADLWNERQILSVANLTRRDGDDFLAVARQVGVRTETSPYPLAQANEALEDLRAGRVRGAAVLRP